MWNIRVLCPALGPVVVNTCRSKIDLFVGGETILSVEGTTQGDPLAMAIYAIAITPLVRRTNLEAVPREPDLATVDSNCLKTRSWTATESCR